MDELYEIYKNCSAVCTDTRKLQKNAIFFALRGANFNGNKFAKQALKEGCAYAVIDDPEYFDESDARLIPVENALRSLQLLANKHRRAINAKVSAVTGSNGKTTTKELAALVLSKKYKVKATPGNFNNHIGLPLSILAAEPDTEILLLEMGDNRPGDIRELCEIAEPETGIITNIGKDHIEGFGNFEGNIASKNELFLYLNNSGGTVLYNTSENLVAELAGNIERAIPYGPGSRIDLTLEEAAPFVVYSDPKTGKMHSTRLIGEYNFQNILTAFAIGIYYGITRDAIHEAVKSYTPDNNRSQWIETEKNNKIVLDAYNANPSSVIPALENFGRIEFNGKKVVVLGDMLELGDISDSEHQLIVDKLNRMNFDEVILTGVEFQKTSDHDFHSFRETDDTRDYLKKRNYCNALFLLKGSRSLKLESLVDEL